MLSYTLRRLLYTVPIALGVTIFVFALIHLSGDPINAVVAPDATAETVAKLKKDYGFDKPLPLQYLLWLGKALQGDFGYSIVNSRPVLATLLLAVPNTLMLACFATLIGFTLGALLGGLAGFYQGRLVDKLATGIGIAGVSVPHYWLGMVLVIIFAVELQLLPATGMGPGGSSGWEWDWLHIKHLILPAVTLSVIPCGIITRTVRATVAEILKSGIRAGSASKGAFAWPSHPTCRQERGADGACRDGPAAGLPVGRLHPRRDGLQLARDRLPAQRRDFPTRHSHAAGHDSAAGHVLRRP